MRRRKKSGLNSTGADELSPLDLISTTLKSVTAMYINDVFFAWNLGIWVRVYIVLHGSL